MFQSSHCFLSGSSSWWEGAEAGGGKPSLEQHHHYPHHLKHPHYRHHLEHPHYPHLLEHPPYRHHRKHPHYRRHLLIILASLGRVKNCTDASHVAELIIWIWMFESVGSNLCCFHMESANSWPSLVVLLVMVVWQQWLMMKVPLFMRCNH